MAGESPDARARRLRNARRLPGAQAGDFFAQLNVRAPPANNVNIPGIVNALNDARIPPAAKAAVIRANSGKTLVKTLPAPPAAPIAVNRRRGRDPVKNMIRINNIVKNKPGTYRPIDEHGIADLQAIPGYRFGMCPVCLITLEEDSGGAHCLYHSHVCSPSTRNDTLWNKYKSAYGSKLSMEFCFTCGRGTSHHGHYTLTMNDEKPELYPVKERGTFWDCTNSGGGGRPELIARLLGIIDYVNGFQDGSIEYNKEFVTGCSWAGEFAAANKDYLSEARTSLAKGILVRKIRDDLGYGNVVQGEPPVGYQPPTENVPVIARLSTFARFLKGMGGLFSCVNIRPGNVGPPPALAAEAAPAEAVAAGQLVRGNSGRRLAVLGECPAGHNVPDTIAMADKGALRCFMCMMMGDPEDDEVSDLYRFRHSNQNGEMYNHTDEQLVCKVHLVPIIQASLDRGDANCFINNNGGCGGNIHFCELGMLLPENQQQVNRYRAVCGRVGLAGGKRKTRHHRIKRRHSIKKRK
jgi:hypothetical protein